MISKKRTMKVSNNIKQRSELEENIISLKDAGLSNIEISKVLGVSESTIRNLKG